ncbi:sugar kinase [Mucilaginibacter sp. RS28]|uniref:Sugar kinase n=1 Tax=Mucilaginibacter straminoryzae TaxID=2932774 RepID=A0A9X1X0W0_9SPHI|nr:sugar kinase [Mucilaginibacter straminoryzae]MCJ8209182.1 sugar kinase [Mucilaginibacter straminoryzae]
MGLQVEPGGSVLSFGELLIRFCPDGDGNWLKENSLKFYLGGAELNVATALALWGVKSKYFTALPDNGMSNQVLSLLEEKNIDTSAVHFGGKRIGTFYLTTGRDMKNDALIYDRAGSSFAELGAGVIDWDKVFEGVKWFHFSAICPALSQNVADLCEEALAAASERGILISVDLNYRAKLWQYGKSPKEVMPSLAKYCDLIMGNIWAAEKMLDIPVDLEVTESGQKSIYLKAAQWSSQEIMKQYPKCRAVANTFRFDGGKDIAYYTALYTDEHLYHSFEYNTDAVVDKVGSGDCFMAGLIYGYYNNLHPSDTLAFATAAAFEKLFIAGDATHSTVEEIKQAIQYEN